MSGKHKCNEATHSWTRELRVRSGLGVPPTQPESSYCLYRLAAQDTEEGRLVAKVIKWHLAEPGL